MKPMLLPFLYNSSIIPRHSSTDLLFFHHFASLCYISDDFHFFFNVLMFFHSFFISFHQIRSGSLWIDLVSIKFHIFPFFYRNPSNFINFHQFKAISVNRCTMFFQIGVFSFCDIPRPFLDSSSTIPMFLDNPSTVPRQFLDRSSTIPRPFL